MAAEPHKGLSDSASVIGIQTINNKEHIFSILTAVQKARGPITIKFEQHDEQFTSLILRTNRQDSHLIIDEIAPEAGHELAKRNLPFSIRGNHNGVNFFFRHNVITGSGIESGIAFYRIPLPGEMIYQQRRTAYRAPVSRARDIRAVLSSESRNLELDGRLYDISIGGCRINFEGDIAERMIRSDLFERASIPLNNGYVLHCPLVVKHAHYIQEWRETSCGFSFEGQDTATRREIDRFVYFLQREARRLETRE